MSRTMIKRIALSAVLSLWAASAVAQWQVPSAAIPVGRGAGVVGFNSIASATAGFCLKANGAGVAPSFQSCGATGANPTATAGPAAINGVAATFMRSDAAPAIQLGTNAQKGLLQVDGTTISAAAGVIAAASTTFGGQVVAPGGSATVQGNGAKIQLSTGAATSGDCVKFDANGNTVANGSACGGATGANPTATASDVAVNGVAATFMRSDGAPAIQKGTNAVFGVVEGDNVTISCAAGICGQKSTTLTNSLGADVALNNTANYFTGPTVAQGTTGVFFASGTVTLTDTAGAVTIYHCKLWDATTVIASSAGSASSIASSPVSISLSGVITNPAADLRISCKDPTATTGKILFNVTGTSKDSTLTVTRIQ